MSDPNSESTHHPKILRTFHPYPRLPTELRTMILDAAMIPRDVNINYANWKDIRLDRFYSQVPLRGSLSVPGLLHTYRESREHFLKSYNLFHDAGGAVLPLGYFNFDIDRLSLGVKMDEEWHAYIKSLSPPLRAEEQEFLVGSELEAFTARVNIQDRIKIRRIVFQRNVRPVGPDEEGATGKCFPRLESLRVLAKVGLPETFNSVTAWQYVKDFKKTFLEGTRMLDGSGQLTGVWSWKVRRWADGEDQPQGVIVDRTLMPDDINVRAWRAMSW